MAGVGAQLEEAERTESPLPPAAIAGSFAAMALIGGVTSFYGPLLPYLEARYGVSRATAGGVLGADFGGSLAGVVWVIWAVRRLPAVLIALALVTPVAPFAYAAAGLALAPVWPTGVAWLAESHPGGNAIYYLMVASMLGGAVFPYATGWIIQRAGVRATPAVLAGFPVACLAIFAVIAWGERRSSTSARMSGTG
jgi:MFS family permease